MGLAVACNGCATAKIPASLKAPCVSTVDVEGAKTVGDLGQAVIAGDADLALCSLKKDAIVEIVEGRSGWRWWR